MIFQILKDREDLFEYAKDALRTAAESLGEKLIVHSRNSISLAITLEHLHSDADSKGVTFLGAKLFSKSNL